VSANEKAASGCTPEAAHAKTDPTLRSISQATGAAPVLADALRRSPWRPLASLAGYGDERDDSGDPAPPTPPPDRENESVEQRKRRTGYDGAFERPERWTPSERPDDGFGVRP
jgi:hypothetical protein